MSDARSQATQALDGLLGQGVLAAGLVGRDGLPVLLRATRPIQESTFCAMGAALLASGEAAVQELQELPSNSTASTLAFVEAGEFQLAAAGLDDAHLLLVVAPAKLGAEKLRSAVQAACKSLRAVLGG